MSLYSVIRTHARQVPYFLAMTPTKELWEYEHVTVALLRVDGSLGLLNYSSLISDLTLRVINDQIEC